MTTTTEARRQANREGGDGNDYISSSADTPGGRQAWGPNDGWLNWGLPEGKTALRQGPMWGSYITEQTDEFKVTVWSGIGSTRQDSASTEGDSVDAGAGDDWVMGSWADDRIQGGDGKDQLDGLAGNDILEGGDGDDNISADGITKEGYLNTVDAASHGSDFADGGEGDDQILGGGKDDQLFGGAGKDNMFGDSAGKTDGEFYVELQYHGQDYLDGEDGDDYLEGGGKEDTLYGGMGADKFTIKSIAVCASKQRARCQFHCNSRNLKRRKRTFKRNLVRFSAGSTFQQESHA